MNVGQDTTSGNGDISEQLVQFLVILDSQGDVARHNTALLVVTSGVSGEFEDFGTQVFQDGRQVDGGPSTHTSGVLALTQVTSDTTDGELQTSLGGRAGGALLLSTASLALSFASRCCVGKDAKTVLEGSLLQATLTNPSHASKTTETYLFQT